MVGPGPHWVASYDPRTGHELWRARHGEGFSIGASAVFGDGLVFFSTGCFKAQLIAIRADGAGDVTATHIAWKSLRQVPIMPSPVLAGPELYWVSDDGMVTCAEASTGAIHWQERLGGAHLATPLFAGGRLYCFGQNGKTTVLQAGPRFEKLRENTLPGTVVASPALSGRSLFYRTDTHLYRLEQR
jgi:outer membrane protein assembly factor BamB